MLLCGCLIALAESSAVIVRFSPFLFAVQFLVMVGLTVVVAFLSLATFAVGFKMRLPQFRTLRHYSMSVVDLEQPVLNTALSTGQIKVVERNDLRNIAIIGTHNSLVLDYVYFRRVWSHGCCFLFCATQILSFFGFVQHTWITAKPHWWTP